jgi:hypothetical protein
MATQQQQQQQQQQQEQLTIPTSTAETTQEEEQSIILDSLPYIDQIHPDYEAYALTLIEEEMMQHPPPSSSSSPSSSTPHHLRIPDFQYSQNNVKIMQEEYKQLVARNGQKKSEQDNHFLSLYHHDKLLPAATTTEASQDDNENHHDSCLIESIRTAKIILQHEKIRQINLELYAECTSSSMMWKHHVNMMDKYYAQASKKLLEEQLMVVDQLNAERKQMQEEAMKNYLGKLEYRWGELIRKKQHLVKGVKMLEDEMMGWDE